MDSTQLRIVLIIVGLIFLAGVYFFGRPRKPDQGTRFPSRRGSERIEPVLGEESAGASGGLSAEAIQTELQWLEQTLAGSAPPAENSGAESETSKCGQRPQQAFDRVVVLFVTARQGEVLNGADLVVAAEKTGLVFGHMGVFHRLVDGKPEQGPIFSVANMVKPGSFDMATIGSLQTPGLSFFMTLPGPIPALDAWDTMLPTAQRIAELLDAQVLDEQRNALGRQRVAHIRDELRAYDRQREQQEIRTSR